MSNIVKCPHCGKRMTRQGLEYHIDRKVCRKDEVSRETEPEPAPEPRWNHRVQIGGASVWVRR